jgi:predicted RNA binding protein YcfA (HicA-like mRNA interferase family)
LKVRNVIKMIQADGWSLVSTRGSHRQFKHLFKKGRVTIAGKPDMDLHLKTLKSIFKQAGLKEIEDD